MLRIEGDAFFRAVVSSFAIEGIVMSGRIVAGVLAALGAIVGLAAPAGASMVPPGGFQIHQAYSAGDPINSLADAVKLLDGTMAQSGYADATGAVINFVDPDHAASGHFGNDYAFPGDVAGVDDDLFAIEVTAHLLIPTAGIYTFGVTSDDGFSLKVDRFSMSYSSPRGVGDTLGAFNFTAPGDFDLTLKYFDRYNSAGVELYAGKGSIMSAGDSRLHLVGDVANGGLALNPEPTFLMPLSGIVLLLRRRRA